MPDQGTVQAGARAGAWDERAAELTKGLVDENGRDAGELRACLARFAAAAKASAVACLPHDRLRAEHHTLHLGKSAASPPWSPLGENPITAEWLRPCCRDARSRT